MPGEQRDLIFLLGYVENAQEEKYADPHADPTLITSLGALDRTIVNKEKAHATIERFSKNDNQKSCCSNESGY